MHVFLSYHGSFSPSSALFMAAIFMSNCSLNTGVSDNINYGRVPFSVSRLTAILVSQHTQYKSPGQPKWNSAIINVINYTGVYPATGVSLY